MRPRQPPSTIGRYKIVQRIGAGGMGVVYHAQDPTIGRAVAIKLLRVTDDDLRHRFLQEARSSGNLKHVNIVTVYDFGEYEEQPYIVMEFIEGTTLASIIKDKAMLPVHRKVGFLEALAAGLDYAHERGVIHRDVKPANIMIDREGVLRILDFGVARAAESGMTRAGTIMGTPNYMSPEQVEGLPADRRSDIFSFGLVAYELLSYRQAFAGQTAPSVMHAITRVAPTPLEELCPELDPALWTIVTRAIEKDPARRYATLKDLSSQLARVRQRLPTGALDDSTIIQPRRSSAGAPTPRGTDRDVLARRREAAISAHLAAAAEAFDAGDYRGAIESCEQAAMIDPDSPRVLAKLEQAHAAADAMQVRRWTHQARNCLSREDIGAARGLLERAHELRPDSPEVLEVEADIADMERQLRDRSERARIVEVSLAQARQAIEAERAETAIRAAHEVLAHDPSHLEARELTRQALAIIERRQAEQAHALAAHAAVQAFEREFDVGRMDDAIRSLQEFSPPHPVVTEAIEELMRRREQIRARLAFEEQERTRLEEERRDADRRAAEESLRRRQHVEERLRTADAEISNKRLDTAREALRRARDLDPSHPGISPLEQRLNETLRTAIEDQSALRRISDAKTLAIAGESERGLELLHEGTPRADVAAAHESIKAAYELAVMQQATELAMASEHTAEEVAAERLAGDQPGLVPLPMGPGGPKHGSETERRSWPSVGLATAIVIAIAGGIIVYQWPTREPDAGRTIPNSSANAPVANTIPVQNAFPVNREVPSDAEKPSKEEPGGTKAQDRSVVEKGVPKQASRGKEKPEMTANSGVDIDQGGTRTDSPGASSSESVKPVVTTVPPVSGLPENLPKTNAPAGPAPPAAVGSDDPSIKKPDTTAAAAGLETVTALQLVRSFFDLYGTFDLDGLARISPTLAQNARSRILTLRSEDFKSCSYAVSDLRVTETSGTRAAATANVVESCSQGVRAKDRFSVRGVHRFEFERTSDSWRITGHYWS